MPVHNAEIADIFDPVADLLEIEDAKAQGCWLKINARPWRELSTLLRRGAGR